MRRDRLHARALLGQIFGDTQDITAYFFRLA